MVTNEFPARGASYVDLLQNWDAIDKLAKAITLSGMFNVQDKEQGLVIAADCFLTGMTPLEYQRRNHIIMGKPSMKYDAMLAEFNSIEGNRVRILSKTPEMASILVIQGDVETEFTLTWEDAQKEPFVYDGKESKIVEQLQAGTTPPLKAKYATPRSRAIMMFARVVSDAIRSVAPEVCYGKYTPEEIEDFDTVEGAVVSNTATLTAPKATGSPAKPKSPAATATKPAEEASQPTPETAAQVAPAGSVATTEATAAEADKMVDMEALVSDVSGPIGEDQVQQIRQLLAGLKANGINFIPALKAKLDTKSLKLEDLTSNSAKKLITCLEMKEIEKWADDQINKYVAPS